MGATPYAVVASRLRGFLRLPATWSRRSGARAARARCAERASDRVAAFHKMERQHVIRWDWRSLFPLGFPSENLRITKLIGPNIGGGVYLRGPFCTYTYGVFRTSTHVPPPHEGFGVQTLEESNKRFR